MQVIICCLKISVSHSALCMQVANSWGQGVDKRSFEERKAFVQEHLELILDSAERPFDGHRYVDSLHCSALSKDLHIVYTTCQAIWQPAFFPSPPHASPLLLQSCHFCLLCISLCPCSRQIEEAQGSLYRRWWQSAEKPWETLAACTEVRDALATGNPAEFVSRLPVQIDGSCNGLQHYAALSRDLEGGTSVNLMPCDRPQACNFFSHCQTVHLQLVLWLGHLSNPKP